MLAVLQRMRAEVEKHCDYVGPQFADEARKMHRGESELSRASTARQPRNRRRASPRTGSRYRASLGAAGRWLNLPGGPGTWQRRWIHASKSADDRSPDLTEDRI